MIQGPHSLGPTRGGVLWAKTTKPLSPSKHPVAGCPGTARSSDEAATLGNTTPQAVRWPHNLPRDRGVGAGGASPLPAQTGNENLKTNMEQF